MVKIEWNYIANDNCTIEHKDRHIGHSTDITTHIVHSPLFGKNQVRPLMVLIAFSECGLMLHANSSGDLITGISGVYGA